MAMKKGTTLISANDKKILERVGARIKEIREKKKLSVYDVSGEDLQIKSRQHWQKIEAGKLSINLVTFLKVAEALEVDPQEILKVL